MAAVESTTTGKGAGKWTILRRRSPSPAAGQTAGLKPPRIRIISEVTASCANPFASGPMDATGDPSLSTICRLA